MSVKPKWFKSLRTVLIVPFVFSFMVSVSIIAVMINNDNQKALTKVVDELRKSMISLVQNDLDATLRDALQLLQINETAYENGVLNLDMQSKRERYFAALLKNYPAVAMTYVGYPDGQFYGARRNLDGTLDIVRNNATTHGNSEYFKINAMGEGTNLIQVYKSFDPRKRPWYILAEKSKVMSFGPLYSHFVFHEPTLTASLPIYENGKLRYVMGVDYLMTRLGDTLKKLPIGKHGQVFIMGETGDLIATTTGESVFKTVNDKPVSVLAEESTNPLTKQTVKALLNNHDQTIPNFKLRDKTYYFGVDQYQNYGVKWRIVTVIERSDFLSSMDNTLKTAYFTIFGICLVVIFSVALLSREIVRPIFELNAGAKRLAKGIYQPVELHTNQYELVELTHSFNEMGQKLTDMVDTLEDQVQMRTIQLEEKNKELNELTYMDKLSQIPNRRRFDEFLELAMAVSNRSGASLGLLLLDIDHFKCFNDSYGHVEGDICIQKIAAVMKGCVHRKSDLIARYGGEEFAVVLQDVTQEVVLSIAEEIRAGIEALGMPNVDAAHGVVTVSIGAISAVVEDHQRMAFLIQRADESLYKAKNAGRNRVVYQALSNSNRVADDL